MSLAEDCLFLREDEIRGRQLVDSCDAAQSHLEVGAAVAVAVDLHAVAGLGEAGLRPAAGEGGIADPAAVGAGDAQQDGVGVGRGQGARVRGEVGDDGLEPAAVFREDEAVRISATG